MAEGLHVHIHCAGIRTSGALQHTKNRFSQIVLYYFLNSKNTFSVLVHLQADGQVDPGAKSSADSSG